MIYNERQMRTQSVRALAEAVMVAARTAPKAKGRDMVEVAMITDEHIEQLSNTMLELSAESGMKFLLRDAANVLQAEAIIVIGIKDEVGYCSLNWLLRLCTMRGETRFCALCNEWCRCGYSNRCSLLEDCRCAP